jgi:spermidine synthase
LLGLLASLSGWLGWPVLARAAERLIYQVESQFNDALLVTEDEEGLRTLRFRTNGARQSVVKPGDPDHLAVRYIQAFPVGLLWQPQPQRILIVGLGGGSISMFLHKHLPEASIDTVELDPAVVAVARSHFGLVTDARLQVHVGDGRAFIEQAQPGYDLILLDAYGGDGFPHALATQEFLRSVKRVLSPQGVVLSNVWSRQHNSHYDDMVASYRSLFGFMAVMDLEGVGNKLLIARHQPEPFNRAALISRASALSRRLGLRVGLGPMVRMGLRLPDAQERAGKVLLDSQPPATTG